MKTATNIRKEWKMSNMPKVNIQDINNSYLSDEDAAIISIIVKKNGAIRATKPKVNKNNPISGKAAYVWRMVVFSVSPKRQHQCMPCTATFDLPAYDEDGKWKCEISRKMSKELDKLVDHIVNSVPKTQWHGVSRWAKAFGY
jgi:hypothetical protein